MAASKPLLYSYCGREYQFTSKDKGYVEKYLCAICIQLLFDPVQTSCGHLFCHKCLKKWTKNTCPTCQTVFTGPALTDNFNNREVKNLTVLCPNVSRGCEWKGELGSVEAHQKDHCAYQLVECPNKCGTAVERRELEEHKKDHCELREYECPYCKNAPEDNTYLALRGYKGTYRDVTTKHFLDCLCYPVDCPNNCGAQGLVRGDLPTHLAACPEQVIPCRHQTLGCKVRLARKEMSSHLEDKDGHLVLAMGTTSDLVHQLSRVEAEHKMSTSDLVHQLSRVEAEHKMSTDRLQQQITAEHKMSTDRLQQQITTLQQQVSVLLKKSGVQLPSALQHPAKPWLKVGPLPLYPPFTIKMNVSTKDEDVSQPLMLDFGTKYADVRSPFMSQFRSKNEDVSPPFMSHPGGYRLVVRAVYNYDGYYLQVKPVDCPENNSLKWPVTITIKWVILNQEEDKDHIELSQVSTLHQIDDEWTDSFNTTLSTWANAGAEEQFFLRVISVDVSL